MVTLIFSTGKNNTREGSFTTLDIIKLKKKSFRMMWTFICRHWRVLDIIKAHIAMPCEAIIVTSSPNPHRINSLQNEVSASGNPQSMLCVLAVSGPCCPQSLAWLFFVLCTIVGLTQSYATGILGSQQLWQRVDNHRQEITGRGVW